MGGLEFYAYKNRSLKQGRQLKSLRVMPGISYLVLQQIITMKKYTLLAVFFLSIVFSSCNTTTPEQYFDRAVLTSNMFTGFADNGMERELSSPSVKMDDHGHEAVMKRSEVVSSRLEVLNEDFEKLKGLKETGDTKDILQSSKKLYEFALPVYKKEYMQLAALYDENAAKEDIEAQAKAIHDKYFPGYEKLYNTLIAYGKVYAEKHNIKINFVSNSPYN